MTADITATQIKTTNESKKFVSDVLWVALSQIFTTSLGVITLPVLTKTYSPEIYGIWSQVNVTVGLLVSIITLQLVTATVRFLAGEEDNVKRRRLMGTMLYTILIFASIILLAGNVWAPQISVFIFDDPDRTDFVRLAFLLACGDSLQAFFVSYLRARGKIKTLSFIQTIISGLKMALIVILVLSGLALQWVIAGMVFVDLVCILYVLYIIVRGEGFPVFNFTGLRGFLAFSVPQIPVSILAWVMSVSDRYFITHFVNISETGIYSSSSALAGLIALFYFPIAYVLFPVVSKTWEQNGRSNTRIYFENSTRFFLTLAIPAAVGLSMISQLILSILATSEYLAGIGLVLLIAVSQIFLGIYQINEYVIYLFKQTRWLPVITVISGTISVILNFTLIPYLGIMGAAISKIAACFVLAIIVTIWAKKVINYRLNIGYLARVVTASLIMATCLYLLQGHGVLFIIINIIVGVFSFGIALYLLRAFSNQDKLLIRQVLARMVPKLNRKD